MDAALWYLRDTRVRGRTRNVAKADVLLLLGRHLGTVFVFVVFVFLWLIADPDASCGSRAHHFVYTLVNQIGQELALFVLGLSFERHFGLPVENGDEA